MKRLMFAWTARANLSLIRTCGTTRTYRSRKTLKNTWPARSYPTCRMHGLMRTRQRSDMRLQRVWQITDVKGVVNPLDMICPQYRIYWSLVKTTGDCTWILPQVH